MDGGFFLGSLFCRKGMAIDSHYRIFYLSADKGILIIRTISGAEAASIVAGCEPEIPEVLVQNKISKKGTGT